MSRISNRKRFKPKSEIEWIDHTKREGYRNTLSRLQHLITSIEEEVPITETEEQYLFKLCHDSTDTDTWLNALYSIHEASELSYLNKLAAMAPYDLTAFHEFINPDQPPAAHHIYLCDHLTKMAEGKIKTLIVSFPPGAAKSTYGSRSFVQWWMGLNPYHEILAIGHGQKFVEAQFSVPNRRVIDSDSYQQVFPDVCLDKDKKSAPLWMLDNGKGKYNCMGVEGPISGIRANLVVCDDPYKSSEIALSSAAREKIWTRWTVDIMPRRLPGSPILCIQTRWASDDIAGKIETNITENPDSVAKPAVVLNIPAEAEEDDPLGREPGGWLWPEYYSEAHYLTNKMGMTAAMWSCLYNGKPLDKFGEYVSEDQFSRYDRVPQNAPDKPIEWVKTVISIDTASKANERSDFTAMIVFREDIHGNHHIIDVWRKKESLETLIRVIKKLINTWEVSSVLIEDNGMGSQILQNYSGKFQAPLLSYVPSSQSSKSYRFDAALPWITAGKIVFPQTAPWMADLAAELIAFPNAKHDDQVDAISQYTDHENKNINRGGSKKLIMGY